jgi:type IV secretion system protein VirD4
MVPEEKLTIYRGFLRVLIGCALIAMTRSKAAVPRQRTLLLLDEAAALGSLQPIENGVGYLATYMTMIMVWQDLDQLQRTYRRARSIIANAGCKVAFNVSDIDTARMLAEQIGFATILSHSASQSQSNLDPVRQNLSQGISETARYLVDPAEIMRLPDRQALILMPRQVTYPILAKKVRYWRERRWKGLWDEWRPGSHPLPAPAKAPVLASRQEPSIEIAQTRPALRRDDLPEPDALGETREQRMEVARQTRYQRFCALMSLLVSNFDGFLATFWDWLAQA